MRLEDEGRNAEGERLGAYMDATQEGSAFLASDGTWRSVRDTWCNSHAGFAEGQIVGREESASQKSSEEGSGEESEEDAGGESVDGSEDDSEENSESEEAFEEEENSDDDFVDVE